MFSLLGMDPRAAFPIMMGSGAFVATIAGLRFIGARRLHWRASLGLTAGGIPGVIVAAWLVQSLPLEALRWLVLVVVAYAAVTLLRAGLRGSASVADSPDTSREGRPELSSRMLDSRSARRLCHTVEMFALPF